MFSYLAAADGRWHPFSEVLEQTDVVLVFAPTTMSWRGSSGSASCSRRSASSPSR
jgi:hypothetical protein